ncbi:MAG: ATP-binding cassette domain-containing protein [Treponema sp.]|jgi:ABC-type multidrug transport system ATPase subunit|nr:ATP-binding cassette domain-containing protein [Treponema sp.]
MINIIELKNVSFSAQDRNVIQSVSASFNTGKTTALVGPSGSGKSTVLKLAGGLLVPTEGEVLYRGNNVALMNRNENLQFRCDSAFVFQDSALWANQNLDQILELPLKIHFPEMKKKDRAQKIKSLTELVGYKKELNIRPSRLSMGEQKLIGFARALLCSPTLLYLDEWVESLDENAADRLIGIVKKMQKDGVTVLFVCHDMRIIKILADYIMIIIDGQIVIHDTKENIMNDTELSNYLKTGLAL